MMSELLSPLIRRVFGILWRGGMLPPLPPVLMQRGIANIEIEYEGPLARAQRSQDILAVERWFSVNNPLLALDPEVIDVLNRDNIGKDTAQVVGMRPSWTHSPEEIADIRAQREQQKAAAAAAAVAQTTGDFASKTAPMMKAMAENPDINARLQQLLGTGV
jgi:hypothetical protein